MSGSSDPGYAGAPTIERVSLEVGGVAGLLVRVEGRWAEAPPPAAGVGAPVLLVRGDRRQFRFPALPSSPSPDGVWRATFSVPAELRPSLERELVLEVGSLAVRLPAPRSGSPGPSPVPPSGTVVDRGVLAERRARRAEAELAALTSKVGRLEAELEELRRSAAEPSGELRTLRSELTRARQRAYAEEQVRLEELGAARAAAESARAAVAALRARVAELEAELRRVRAPARPVARPPRRDGARAAVLAREAGLASLRSAAPKAPDNVPLRPLTAALAAERALAAARSAPLRAPAFRLRPAEARPEGGALRLGELFTSTSVTPSETDAPGPTPDRLDAARERLRATAEELPQPSGPPDPSRLPKALKKLGRNDPAAGGRIVAALAPLATGSFVLALADLGDIAVGDGQTRVYTDTAGLGRLILGSPPRRTLARRAIRIDGRKRALKPLRRLARTPLAWEKLASADVVLDAGLAYRWIALATDPKWTRGERFIVAHTSTVDPRRTWFVRADDGRPLTVTAAEPRDRPAAEIQCPDEQLAAFLAGSPGHGARVTGDPTAVALLLAWANGRRA